MKNSSKNTLVKIYESCEEMPLWNFYKFSETQDLRYFTQSFEIVEGLEGVKEAFMKEYFELSENKDYRKRIQAIDKIMVLSNKYESVNMLIYAIEEYNPILGEEMLFEFVDALEKWHYKLDRKKELFGQLENIKNRLEGLKTTIEIASVDLDKISDNASKEKVSLESQTLAVTRILTLPYKINPKETTVLEWIELQKECLKLQKAHELEKIKKNGGSK